MLPQNYLRLFLGMLGGIKQDKWKHFFVGAAMGVLLEAATLYFFPQAVWPGSAAVFLLIALISYVFELFSLLLKRGHYDVLDAVAGAVGGLLGVLLVVGAHDFQS